MGCSTSESKTSVPIANSLMHLLQSGQTDQVIKRLDQDKTIDKNTPYNFRGDTLLHYSCSKNNYKLTDYLIKNGADKNKQNKEGLIPADLATDSRIIELCGGQKTKPKPQEPVQRAEQPMNNTQQTKGKNENADPISKPLFLPNHNYQQQKNNQDSQKANNIRNTLSYKKMKESSAITHNVNKNDQQQEVKQFKYSQEQSPPYHNRSSSPKKQMTRSEHPTNIFDAIKKNNEGGQSRPRDKLHATSYNRNY